MVLLDAPFDRLQESFQPIEQVVATLLEREYKKLRVIFSLLFYKQDVPPDTEMLQGPTLPPMETSESAEGSLEHSEAVRT